MGGIGSKDFDQQVPEQLIDAIKYTNDMKQRYLYFL